MMMYFGPYIRIVYSRVWCSHHCDTVDSPVWMLDTGWYQEHLPPRQNKLNRLYGGRQQFVRTCKIPPYGFGLKDGLPSPARSLTTTYTYCDSLMTNCSCIVWCDCVWWCEAGDYSSCINVILYGSAWLCVWVWCCVCRLFWLYHYCPVQSAWLCVCCESTDYFGCITIVQCIQLECATVALAGSLTPILKSYR